MLSTISGGMESYPQKNSFEKLVIHNKFLSSNAAYILSSPVWLRWPDGTFSINKESKNSGRIMKIEFDISKSNS